MKPPFRRGLWDAIKVVVAKSAPESQVSEAVRARIIAFMERDATTTDREVYDFMDSVAREPLNEVSSFIVAVFDVRRFYAEPDGSSSENGSLSDPSGT